MPPKPKFERKEVFLGRKPDTSASVPYVSASAANRVYEDGGLSLPDEAFEDPVEKENQELKGQLADLMQQLQGRTSDLVAQDGTLMVQGFQFTPTGLIAPESVSFESWEQVGQLLFRLEGSIQWLIGDWLVYGEELKWGDTTAIAVHLGYEANTLWSYASVCRAVQPLIRIKDLSFAHHRLVMTLSSEQQAEALGYAAEHKLSVAAFRKLLRGDQEQPTLPAGDAQVSRKTIMSQFDKFFDRDPAKAKPQEREQAVSVYQQMAQSLEAYRRKWGIK